MNWELIHQEYAPKLEQRMQEILALFPGFCEEMGHYQLSTGGKRIRGLLPCLVFKAFGRDPLEAIDLGAAAELIHNATLIHDDIQDGDATRRNFETVWKKYSIAQGINCGDALFQFPLLALVKSGYPEPIKLRLIETAARKTLQTIEGQAKEFLLKSNPNPHMNDYLSVVEGKTSGLFNFPIVSALTLLEYPSQSVKNAEKAFNVLGVVFQVNDDLIDLTPSKGRSEIGSDVKEGKMSFMAVHAIMQAEKKDREMLLRILNLPRQHTTDSDVNWAISLFTRLGSVDAARKFIYTELERAEAFLKNDAEIFALFQSLVSLFRPKV